MHGTLECCLSAVSCVLPCPYSADEVALCCEHQSVGLWWSVLVSWLRIHKGASTLEGFWHEGTLSASVAAGKL